MADRAGLIAAMAATLDTITDAYQESAGTYIASRLNYRLDHPAGPGDPGGIEQQYPDHLTDPVQAGQYLAGAQLSLGAAISEVFEDNTWRPQFLGAIADAILLQANALDPHAAVRAATTGNITLSGAQTIDGVAVVAGDRVLVKDQTTGSQNGVYVAAAGAWTRAADMDANGEIVHGTFAAVLEGTANGGTSWIVTTPNPITVGTTATTWELYQGSLTLSAGDGLVRVGNAFNVGAGFGIQVSADAVAIDPAYTGQTSIATLGTITAGAWQASPVAAAYGGTGQSAVALGDLLYGSAPNTWTRLAGNTSASRRFLRQTGTGSTSAAPAWDTLVDADVPATLVRTSRVIATIAPLQGGGSLAGDLSLSVGGLVNLGASNQVVGVNAASTAWEYKSLAGTANRITVSHAAGAVTFDIAGTYVGQTSITTVGTITTGTWNGSVITLAYGGTGLSSYAVGDMLYASGVTTLARLAGNTTTARQFLMGQGTGAAAQAPAWSAIQDADLPGTILRTSRTITTTAPLTGGGDLSANRTLGLAGLSSLGSANQVVGVNAGATAWEYKTFSGTGNRITLSPGAGALAFDIAATYVGQASITTLGTVATGTWQATAVGAPFGGTGQTAVGAGDLLYGSAANTWSRLAGPTPATRQFLTSTGTGAAAQAPVWAAITAADLPGGFAGFANPSATVGLTATNGSAATAMRSDAAPALSQAIAPVWTAVHTFNPGNASQNVIFLGMAQPVAAGTRDSHTLQWRGTAFNTVGHSADWLAFANVTSTAGASSFLLQSRLDGATFTTRFALSDAGIITAATWQGAPVGAVYGGTGLSAVATGDILYGSGANVYSRLAGNTTATRLFLLSVGSGGAAQAPAWSTISNVDLPGGFNGFANPTAQVGLTATNGSAATAMRSDAAPAISQAIAPVWTGTHTWNSGATPLLLINLAMSQPASAGTRNSHVMQFQGASFDTVGHNSDWRAQAVVVTTAGSSAFVLSSRIDAGAFAPRFMVSDTGVISLSTWQGNAVGAIYGGTGQTGYATGDILYASSTTALSRLAANPGAARQFLMSTAGGAPAWASLTASDLPVGVSGTTNSLAKFTTSTTIGPSSFLAEAGGVLTFTSGATTYITFAAGSTVFAHPLGIGSQGATTNIMVNATGTWAGQAGSTQYGVVAQPTFTGTGNAGAIALYSRITLGANVSYSNVYAHYIESANFNSGASATNEYGLYINPIMRGANRWAIYTNDGQVNFGDVVRVRSGSVGSTITGTSTDCGYLALGASGGRQLQFDPDDIQGMNGGSPASVDFNYSGGNLYFGRGASSTVLAITQDITGLLGRLDVRSSTDQGVIAAFGDTLSVNGAGARAGYIYFSATNTINGAYGINADGGELWINYRGYANGNTRYRNLSIGDGRESRWVWFEGANKRITINSGTSNDGFATVYVGGAVRGDYFYNSPGYHNAVFHAEASGTPYFQANDGGTVNVRLSPAGYTSAPYNFFRRPLLVGTEDVWTGSLDQAIQIRNPGRHTYLRIDRESSSYEAGLEFASAGSARWWWYLENGSDNYLQLSGSGIGGESDSVPRLRFSYSNGDIWMAASGGNVRIGDTNTASERFEVIGNGRFLAGDGTGSILKLWGRNGSGPAIGASSNHRFSVVANNAFAACFENGRTQLGSTESLGALHSTLQVEGSISAKYVRFGSTASFGDQTFVDINAAGTYTLPTAASCPGRAYFVLATTASTFTLARGNGTDTILYRGSTFPTLSVGGNAGIALILVSNGSNQWIVFNSNS